MASVLLTWPLVFHMRSTLFGDCGDSYGVVWWTWATSHGLLKPAAKALVAAPFGYPRPAVTQPLYEAFLVLSAKFIGEIAAYNLVVFFSFPLTALATYAFLRWLVKDRFAAFVGGLIFGFSPASVMQAAAGHVGYALNFFLPLFLFSLFLNRRRRDFISALCVAGSYMFLTMMSLYFGYFALYIGFFFAACDFWSADAGDYGRMAKNYAYCGLSALILLLPVEYPAILEQLISSRDTFAKIGHGPRPLVELVTLSARPWEFLIPPVDNPVLGPLVGAFSRNHLHGSNLFEQTLYIGFVPLGLLTAGAIMAAKKPWVRPERECFIFFAAGAAWMIILSEPPYVPILRLKIPTLTYITYRIAPMFRVYARFGILANLFVAGAAATVLCHLREIMPKRSFYGLALGLLVVLIFEYWTFAPNYAQSIAHPPAVYQWLAQQPGDFIVAEYPMMPNNEAAFYNYLFWQRVHAKRLVNGIASDDKKAWDFYQKVSDLSDARAPDTLKEAGVRFIIVHGDMYKEGQIPYSLKKYYPPYIAALNYDGGKPPSNKHLPRPYKTFGFDVVYMLGKDG